MEKLALYISEVIFGGMGIAMLFMVARVPRTCAPLPIKFLMVACTISCLSLFALIIYRVAGENWDQRMMLLPFLIWSGAGPMITWKGFAKRHSN